MTDSQLLSEIDKLLTVTLPLKNQENRPSPFLIIMTATFRRAYHTVQAIRLLGQHEHLSGSMFILVRSLLEDVISIEYILSHDAEDDSRKFYDYLNIQKFDDLSFIVEHDVEARLSLAKQIKQAKENYENYKPHFLDKRGGVFRSWNNKLVGQMIADLKKERADGFDKKLLPWYSKLYLDGNRKAHFNPSDLLPYLNESSRKIDSRNHIHEGLVMALVLFARLTYRYTVAYQIITDDTQFDDITLAAINYLKTLEKVE